jgi:hypothetical protein
MPMRRTAYPGPQQTMQPGFSGRQQQRAPPMGMPPHQGMAPSGAMGMAYPPNGQPNPHQPNLPHHQHQPYQPQSHIPFQPQAPSQPYQAYPAPGFQGGPPLMANGYPAGLPPPLPPMTAPQRRSQPPPPSFGLAGPGGGSSLPGKPAAGFVPAAPFPLAGGQKMGGNSYGVQSGMGNGPALLGGNKRAPTGPAAGTAGREEKRHKA